MTVRPMSDKKDGDDRGMGVENDWLIIMIERIATNVKGYKIFERNWQ